MTDPDPPQPPRDNRTIVRPNPAGRRAVPPKAPPTEWKSEPARRPPPVAWDQPADRPVTPAGAAPLPAARYSDAKGTANEEWIASSLPPTAPTAAPRRALLRIDELLAPNANPLMRAAAPLLLLLGRLRASLLAARFASLMDQVAQAIQKFDAEIRAAGLPDDQVNMAKYILCATADDIVQNIPADDRHEWSRHSMLSSFFGERTGGVRFFDLVERSKKDPVVNYSLLELEHACVALGFQGLYRSEGGGPAALQQVQRAIYETLRRVRPRTARDLSPHWRGQVLGARRSKVHVPVWASSAVLGVLLIGLYLVLRYLLGGGAEAASGATLALNQQVPITIERKTYSPPPPPPAPTPRQLTQLQRIRAALAPEIKAGTISVPDPTGPNWIVINVGSLLLFRSGGATIIDKFDALAARIRGMLERETGTIQIIGHTDNTRISPMSPFKSNYELSVARATNTAAILKQGFSNPDRFKLAGKGADAPIADNRTEVGRRLNRRVEILVQRTD